MIIIIKDVECAAREEFPLEEIALESSNFTPSCDNVHVNILIYMHSWFIFARLMILIVKGKYSL